MLIDTELLLKIGGTIHSYKSNDYIFQVDEIPKYYYQIISGDVKLNYNYENGKELIQSLLTDGDSVCELLLFVDEAYPVNAVATSECTLIRVPKKEFLKMLDERPSVASVVSKYIATTLAHKLVMMQNMACVKAEDRIMGTLRYFKSFYHDKTPFSYELKLTRQQFACITGLRTETVIRWLKKFETSGIVKIIDRKVFY